MSEREHLKALNAEIQKLNKIIDRRIIEGIDYKREARRHKALLSQLRADESRNQLMKFIRSLNPLWL